MNTDNLINTNTMKKICYSIIICLLSSSQILSQPTKLYSKHEIVKDINFLIEDIEKIHPEPYHSVEKTDFLEIIEDLKNQIPDSISKIDAWRKFYPILALLKEGHSYFYPPVEEIGDFLRFPYTIKIDKALNNFIISGSLIDSLQAPIGNRIISINGISTDSLITIFKKSTSAENEALFIFMNELHFDISMYAIFNSPEYFDIEYLLGDKVERYRCRSINKIPDKIVPNFTFSIIHDSIGLIDMNRMNSLRDFKKFCKSTFKSLNNNKISNLIIDFRGNSGGDSQIGDELIKYLSDVPFIQYQKAIVKVSSISREQFHYPSEKDTLLESELAGSTIYLIEPYPEKLRYSGNIFVLIDGGTFSSAGSTVWCIKHYNIAFTIGKETGGTGVHYGYPIKRNLPNTGLTYYISHMKWYQIGADEKSIYGLIPDYKIDLSIEDIKNNRDSALEFALDLIKHGE